MRKNNVNELPLKEDYDWVKHLEKREGAWLTVHV